MELPSEVRTLRTKLPRKEWREREERHRERLEKERKAADRVCEPLAGRPLEMAVRDVELLAAVEELRLFAKNRVQRHVLNQLSREVARSFVETYGFENAKAAMDAAFPETGEPANGTPRKETRMETAARLDERRWEEPGIFRRAGETVLRYAKKPLIWGGAIAVVVIGGVAYVLTRSGTDGAEDTAPAAGEQFPQ